MTISRRYRQLRGETLMHFTHSDNIVGIQNRNAILTLENLKKTGETPSHITDLTSRSIDRRLGYDKCVFLVFSHYHPLIYKNSINDVPMHYFEIDVSILDIPGVKIADRVATDRSVQMYTPEQALEVLKISHCHSTGRVNDREIWDEVKKYEILIPGNINLSLYLPYQRS